MLPDRRIETIRDVPEEPAEGVVRDFKDSGANEVQKTRQTNGKWPIKAHFEAGARHPASGEFAT